MFKLECVDPVVVTLILSYIDISKVRQLFACVSVVLTTSVD